MSANTTDDYSSLVSQLQGLCFGFMGEGGAPEGTHDAVSPQERSGSTSSGPSFELDLGNSGQLGTHSQVSILLAPHAHDCDIFTSAISRLRWACCALRKNAVSAKVLWNLWNLLSCHQLIAQKSFALGNSWPNDTSETQHARNVEGVALMGQRDLGSGT